MCQVTGSLTGLTGDIETDFSNSLTVATTDLLTGNVQTTQ